MKAIYFLIIIFFLLLVVVLLIKNRSLKNKIISLIKKINAIGKLGKGLSDYKEDIDSKKQASKEAILDILEERGKVANQEIEKALDISDATATRYLQELTKEGKIKKQGEGKGVYYTKE